MTSKNKRISLKGIFQIILILILGATVLAACIVVVIKHQNVEAAKREQKARISATEKIVKENKEDMTPYINNLAQECFEIVEKDTDITLPNILKTSLTKLISPALISQGIDQYVDNYISQQSPKRLKMIQIFYKLTLDSNRMIMGAILVVLCLIQLIVDKLYGLTALGVTGLLSGLSVSFIMPLAISEGASSYLNRTVIFDPSILRTAGLMICGISVVVVIIAQLINRVDKKQC